MNLFQKFTALLLNRPAQLRLWTVYARDYVEFQVSAARPDEDAVPVMSPLALHYLNALAAAGGAIEADDAYRMEWAKVYALLEDPEHASVLPTLGLPAVSKMTPALRCEGTLDDTDFFVAIDGWYDGDRVLGSVQLQGPVARQGSQLLLLSPNVYNLLLSVQAFFADEERSPAANRRHWGRIRAAAVAAGAWLDQFLTFTLVLTPEKLHIHLEESDVAQTGVVEIQPWFAGAPANWLKEFDRHSDVPDLYRLHEGEQLVEVIVTPKVKAVLRAIKQMPGRRAAGSLAEKFLSNPFATLGESANEVIDEAQFEQARREAGLQFQRFTAHCTLDGSEIREAGVLVETLDENSASSHIELFETSEQLKTFVVRVETKLKTGLETCEWRNHRLQLLGDTPDQLKALKEIYQAWTAPRIQIKAADVFNLKRYSDRVTGIGVQPAIVSLYIPKPETDPWFPGADEAPAALVQVALDLPGGKKFELLVDEKVYGTLKTAIEKAKAAGKPFIDVPGAPKAVSVENAQSIIDELAQKFERAAEPTDTPIETRRRTKREREELLIRLNVGSTEYQENRARELEFDPRTPPRLPKSLKADVKLKDHQLVGVAWMQHLLTKSPEYCRGAVLADDMGLGKTLQLLAVIAAALEENPQMDPVLVVAPVSLLENWKEESEKFFESGALPLLTLYGDATGTLRVSTSEIESSLLERGFTRFLRDDWIGDKKIVLTTYESLRDLEFSLAAVRWSVMVCDEAQKIKNPAAMVTRAAKKQNVGFRIACTGTPVENSLADLWCLFDYVQPGLLGALNEFGAKYRRPIECETEEQKQRVEELRGIIEPQILRRLKSDVAKDLPRKIIVEEARRLPMSHYQRELYSKALELFRLRRSPGIASPFKNQLGLLHYLRKVCTDPREIGRTFAHEPSKEARQRSPKLDWLIATLHGIRKAEQKAIVFCEFREMQLMLAHYIEEVFGVRPDIINGDTSASANSADSRQKRIRAFQQQPGFGAIILSPVAVGFGVNVQAANHVIHYTRTWNPAKEDQATDRAYRIGQQRDVYVYYPVVHAEEFVTFDVKLDRLLERKRSLSGDMLNGTGDIMPSDFNDVLDVEHSLFDERIFIDDADTLTSTHFEALIAALWQKKGFRYVWLTPRRGDGGVDTVAKTGLRGELVQAKSCRVEEGELGWDAIKDLAGGEPIYRQKFPGVCFQKIAVTNRHFNDTAHVRAEVNQTRLVEREELAQLLQEHRIVMADLERFLAVPEQVC
jgi:hypothetical protein